MAKTFANNYIISIFFHYLYFVYYSDSKLLIIYNVRKEFTVGIIDKVQIVEKYRNNIIVCKSFFHMVKI